MMDLPTTPADTWTRGFDLPSRFFGSTNSDYELYEDDDAFVLTVELPGFSKEDIDLNWYEGRLNISAEHEDERRGTARTYHRTFRLPKEIDPDAIDASYTNGVLEVRLPILEGAAVRGTPIEIEG